MRNIFENRILMYLLVILALWFLLRVFLGSLFWFLGSLSGIVVILWLVWYFNFRRK